MARSPTEGARAVGKAGATAVGSSAVSKRKARIMTERLARIQQPGACGVASGARVAQHGRGRRRVAMLGFAPGMAAMAGAATAAARLDIAIAGEGNLR